MGRFGEDACRVPTAPAELQDKVGAEGQSQVIEPRPILEWEIQRRRVNQAVELFEALGRHGIVGIGCTSGQANAGACHPRGAATTFPSGSLGSSPRRSCTLPASNTQVS